MLAVYARYRGHGAHRAQIVAESARALEALPGVGRFEFLGVEDIVAEVEGAQELSNVVLNLLSAQDWAVGIGILPGRSSTASAVKKVAALPRGARAGTVKVRVSNDPQAEMKIAAAYLLVAFVLAKRSDEGKEATALMRSGLNQNEAAAQLGISKQAMSQRLQAAGWQAEKAGWDLACRLVEEADSAL